VRGARDLLAAYAPVCALQPACLHCCHRPLMRRCTGHHCLVGTGWLVPTTIAGRLATTKWMVELRIPQNCTAKGWQAVCEAAAGSQTGTGSRKGGAHIGRPRLRSEARERLGVAAGLQCEGEGQLPGVARRHDAVFARRPAQPCVKPSGRSIRRENCLQAPSSPSSACQTWRQSPSCRRRICPQWKRRHSRWSIGIWQRPSGACERKQAMQRGSRQALRHSYAPEGAAGPWWAVSAGASSSSANS